MWSSQSFSSESFSPDSWEFAEQVASSGSAWGMSWGESWGVTWGLLHEVSISAGGGGIISPSRDTSLENADENKRLTTAVTGVRRSTKPNKSADWRVALREIKDKLPTQQLLQVVPAVDGDSQAQEFMQKLGINPSSGHRQELSNSHKEQLSSVATADVSDADEEALILILMELA